MTGYVPLGGEYHYIMHCKSIWFWK